MITTEVKKQKIEKQISDELKRKILEDLALSRAKFPGNDTEFARSIGIDKSQFSRIQGGDLEGVVSAGKWISIARKIGVTIGNVPKWEDAKTPVYTHIMGQLKKCQEKSMSAILCDLSDIGKTYAAKRYKDENYNVVYVDCSQVKTKQKLIRFIAKELGVGSKGRYSEVYQDLVFYLEKLPVLCAGKLPNPLIILDEAGDLDYSAFLEIKALWNATELSCGFYMMGADGLKEKMSRSINIKKVGYAEIFSRFGKRFGTVIPVAREERERMLQASAAMIIKANAKPDVDVNRLLKSTLGEDNVPSLRRIYKELAKIG